MAGTVEGFTDLAWKLLAEVLPPEPTKRRRGIPHTPFRTVVHTVLDVFITGGRWGELPRSPQWASKSAAHRWLQCWQVAGTLAAMRARLLGLAERAWDDAVAVWGGGRLFFPRQERQ